VYAKASIFVCFVGVARIFDVFWRITPPLCVSHKFRCLVYYYVPPDACIGVKPREGVRLCFLLYLFGYLLLFYCACLQTKRVDLQIFRQDVGIDGHGKQSTRHSIFSRGHVVAWGSILGIKFPPLKCMAKMYPQISETVRTRAKRSTTFEQTTPVPKGVTSKSAR